MVKKYLKKNIKKIGLSFAIILLLILFLSITFLAINYNLKKIPKKNNDIILTIKDDAPLDIFSFKSLIDKFNKENKDYNLILEIVENKDDLTLNSDIYLSSFTAGALYKKDILSAYDILNDINPKKYLSDFIIDESKKQLLYNDEIIDIKDENLVERKSVIFGFFSMFVNKELFYDLFDVNNDEKDKLFSSLFNCSFEEYKVFINNIEAFLKNPKRTKIVLNNNTFYLKSFKTNNVKKMNSIFSTSKYEEATKLENMISNFDNTFLTTNTISKIINDFDFETKHFSGEFDKAVRGNSLVSFDNYNVDISLELFNSNKSLFLYLSDSTYQKFIFNFEDKKNNIDLIPLKSSLVDINNKVYINKFYSFKLNDKDSNNKILTKLLNFLNVNLKKFAPTFNKTLNDYYLDRTLDKGLIKIKKQAISKIVSSLLSEKTYTKEFIDEIRLQFLNDVYQ